jgi:hypothetical protein
MGVIKELRRRLQQTIHQNTAAARFEVSSVFYVSLCAFAFAG